MIWILILLVLCIFGIFLWHPSTTALTWGRKLTMYAACCLISLALYTMLGSPHLRDYPLSLVQKISPNPHHLLTQDSLRAAISKARKNPKTPEHWARLGKLYERANRPFESALHYREAWRLRPENLEFKNAYVQALLKAKESAHA